MKCSFDTCFGIDLADSIPTPKNIARFVQGFKERIVKGFLEWKPTTESVAMRHRFIEFADEIVGRSQFALFNNTLTVRPSLISRKKNAQGFDIHLKALQLAWSSSGRFRRRVIIIFSEREIETIDYEANLIKRAKIIYYLYPFKHNLCNSHHNLWRYVIKRSPVCTGKERVVMSTQVNLVTSKQ